MLLNLWILFGIVSQMQVLAAIILDCPSACICYSEGMVHCQHAELDEIPNDIEISITQLDLSYNNFKSLSNTIKKFYNLKYLNLSHNQISSLTSDNFNGLKHLSTLDLSYNYFFDWLDIHLNTFRSIGKLTSLDLSNNPLRNLPQTTNTFYYQTELVELRLQNCSMNRIPVDALNGLSKLEVLYLNDNPIKTMNRTFELNSVRFIDLSRCNLNFITEHAFSNLIALKTIVLENNMHLKKFTCHSTSLENLILSNGVLEKIPSGQLKRLKFLDLSGNYIKSISANSFDYFYNLETLNLSMNALTDFHEKAFLKLPVIKSIDLSFNKLTNFGKHWLNYSTFLTHLNLSHNYISSLDTINSESLKVLIASHCEIYEINQNTLNLLPFLNTLILARNFLSKLPDRLEARFLQVLDVSYCRIKSVTNETFVNMYNLREINLANNALTSIDSQYFPSANYIIIKDNPWRCDCSKLRNMYEWSLINDAVNVNQLVCSSPEKVSGKTWNEVCSKEWHAPVKHPDTMWYYSSAVIFIILLAFFIIVIIKKIKDLKEKRIELEREARRAEERETLRRMREAQMQLEEEENRNAPDPRDLQRPPSYHEAMLMPKISMSQLSLQASLHSQESAGIRGSQPQLGGSSIDLARRNRKLRKKRRRQSVEEKRASRLSAELTSGSSDNDNNNSEQIVQSQSRLKLNLHSPSIESDF